MRRGDQFLSILTLPPKTIANSANLGGTDGPQNAPRARPFTRYLVNFGHEQSIHVPSFIPASKPLLRDPFAKSTLCHFCALTTSSHCACSFYDYLMRSYHYQKFINASPLTWGPSRTSVRECTLGFP